MSSRRHLYPVGHNVLCFEPDLNKEIILYFAKVIDLRGVRYEEGRYQPIYELHFKGWKDKWNREVSQEMLLDMVPFNVELKRRIDQVVHNVSDSVQRKSRILSIIENTVGADRENRTADTSNDIANSFDWESVPGVWREEENRERQRKRRDKKSRLGLNSTDSQTSSQLSPPPSLRSMSETDSDGERSHDGKALENKPLYAILQPSIQLPLTILRIVQLHQELAHPAQVLEHCGSLCVVDLLQAYVDTFPHPESLESLIKDFTPQCGEDEMRQLLAEADPQTLEYLKHDVQVFDASQQLCGEVCSSLRLMFDVYVETVLLTALEKACLPARPWLLPLSTESESTDDVASSLLSVQPRTVKARKGRTLPFPSSPPPTPQTNKRASLTSKNPPAKKRVTRSFSLARNSEMAVPNLDLAPTMPSCCDVDNSAVLTNVTTATTSSSQPTNLNLLPICERKSRPEVPSLRYPAVFILRLFVRLPQILADMNLSLCRRVLIHRHVMQLVYYLNKQHKLLWK